MANYKKMYLTLAGEVSSAIDHLVLALEKAENIYIDTDESESEDNGTLPE